jgi:NAD(P)-dependent dehydrogenase (short-subunit alcohol dehydrogenase family)
MFNIVITGASRGIGLATALELARAGHSVVATMRNPAASPELGEQAAKEKLPIRIETMDVDFDKSVKEAFGRILAQGPVDVLVNNAGIERTGAIEETPLVDFPHLLGDELFRGHSVHSGRDPADAGARERRNYQRDVGRRENFLVAVWAL